MSASSIIIFWVRLVNVHTTHLIYYSQVSKISSAYVYGTWEEPRRNGGGGGGGGGGREKWWTSVFACEVLSPG